VLLFPQPEARAAADSMNRTRVDAPERTRFTTEIPSPTDLK
jgi:hypothetical protein